MGVELELLFCYYNKNAGRADDFACIDTHKMLSSCYDDLFVMPDGEVPKHFIRRESNEDPYGDTIKLYDVSAVLGIIRKNMDKLTKRDDNGSCDWEDIRVQMAVGMLERLLLMNSQIKVGLNWF